MCVFCEIVKGNIPSYKIYEDDNVLAFLDISQATFGHTLIVTKKHYENFFDLPTEEAVNVIKAAKIVETKLKEKLNISNINLLNNNGEIAGQVVMHYHLHLIPRYNQNDITIKFNGHEIDHAQLKELCEKINK